jgi:putative ABC transport system permease protein
VTTTASPRSRLRSADVGALAVLGLRGRPVRAALSATGVAIGVATLVAVLGISASSRAQLVAQIDALGTNLLTVSPNNGFTGQTASLPTRAPAMISRIGPVTSDAATSDLPEAVYRNEEVPSVDSQAITVKASDTDLLSTVQGHLWAGRFLNAASAALPAVVLGHDAAAALGVDRADGMVAVWLAGQWFDVVGILEPVALAPELDRAALIGFPVAHHLLHQQAPPSEIYVRTDPASVGAVESVLPATADPAAPQNAAVTNPSDALTARADASAAFQSLFLALGGIALFVGGIGIANVMVIGVLERRGEIGLRRAMGARRIHVGVQFVGEAATLSVVGGVAGAVLGACAVTVYATIRHWGTTVPPGVLAGAVAVALAVGALGGLYPAWRAARLSPAEALRAT